MIDLSTSILHNGVLDTLYLHQADIGLDTLHVEVDDYVVADIANSVLKATSADLSYLSRLYREQLEVMRNAHTGSKEERAHKSGQIFGLSQAAERLLIYVKED